MGLALMDGKWRYGGRIDQVAASIKEGRPNGMPAWRGRLTDDQIWQLAAYVRTSVRPGAQGCGQQPRRAMSQQHARRKRRASRSIARTAPSSDGGCARGGALTPADAVRVQLSDLSERSAERRSEGASS